MKAFNIHAKKWMLISTMLMLGVGSVTWLDAKTLTFDDFPASGDYALVENGYEGLQWYYFGVVCGPCLTDGYVTGTVSPPNVAFNLYGNPASIGCGDPFDLNSAWLTATFSDGMPVEVVGWVGTNAVYDNVYTLHKAYPTLINFNYLGVTRVDFNTGAFVMDNLNVTLPTNVATNAETVGVSSVGHWFRPVDGPGHFFSSQTTFAVTDLLIDQSQSAGGGGVLGPVFAQFGTNQQFALTISAPPGQMFLVQPLAGQSARFGGFMEWGYNQFGGTPGAQSFGTIDVSFTDLQGAAPDFSGGQSMIGYENGAFGNDTVTSQPFTNSFSFTSMTLTATVSPPYTNSDVLHYVPRGDCALYVTSGTSSTNDPGYLVGLVPAGSPLTTVLSPVLRMWQGTNGDFNVRFSGTIESAGSPSGSFTTVPGNPQGLYTIPVSNQTVSRFFRSKY
jgi:hypothetical protein